jgi:hypothetical protein
MPRGSMTTAYAHFRSPSPEARRASPH